MNAGQRKAIRDHVETLVGAVAGASVFTFKKATLVNDTPAICIYLEEGDKAALEVSGTLTIRIMAPDQVAVDDVLDGFGDIVQERIEVGYDASAPYQYIEEQGFGYDRDGTESWTALDIRYLVSY